MKPSSILVVRRRIIATQVCDVVLWGFSSVREFARRDGNHRPGFYKCHLTGLNHSIESVPECPQLGPFNRGVSRESITHEISHDIGDKQVLTFFEYLRKRAFESIVEGAQEAVDFLEDKKAPSISTAEATLTKTLTEKDSERDEKSRAIKDRSSNEDHPSSASEQSLPPPRRRGRPRTESKDS